MRWRSAWVLLALICACTAAPRQANIASPAVSDPPPAAVSSTAPPEPSFEPTPSPVPITLPRCPSVTSVDSFVLCPEGARVVIDASIGARDAAAIVAQIADDLAAVQTEFEWTLRGTPRIDVYATNERYADGLVDVFGYSRATADFLVENSVAFFEPALGRIAVSWEAVRDRRPIAAIRHELTHFVTLEACAPHPR